MGQDEPQQAHSIPARPSFLGFRLYIHNPCLAHLAVLVHQQFDDEGLVVLLRPGEPFELPLLFDA
jgi:hypothetical protein